MDAWTGTEGTRVHEPLLVPSGMWWCRGCGSYAVVDDADTCGTCREVQDLAWDHMRLCASDYTEHGYHAEAAFALARWSLGAGRRLGQ